MAFCAFFLIIGKVVTRAVLTWDDPPGRKQKTFHRKMSKIERENKKRDDEARQTNIKIGGGEQVLNNSFIGLWK